MPADQMLFMDISYHPLAGATLRDVEAYSFPNGGDPSRFTVSAKKRWRLSSRPPTPYHPASAGDLRDLLVHAGLEQWFMDMMENPAFCEALIDRTAQFWVDWMQGFLVQVGDLLDVIMIGDDLAASTVRSFRPSFIARLSTAPAASD